MGNDSQGNLFKSLGVSAASAAIAEATTLPLDTAKVRRPSADCSLCLNLEPSKKVSFGRSFPCSTPTPRGHAGVAVQVRLQLRNRSAAGSGPPPGPLKTVYNIWSQEGPGALFKV
jgi:hypothetical protein